MNKFLLCPSLDVSKSFYKLHKPLDTSPPQQWSEDLEAVCVEMPQRGRRGCVSWFPEGWTRDVGRRAALLPGAKLPPVIKIPEVSLLLRTKSVS